MKNDQGAPEQPGDPLRRWNEFHALFGVPPMTVEEWLAHRAAARPIIEREMVDGIRRGIFGGDGAEIMAEYDATTRSGAEGDHG